MTEPSSEGCTLISLRCTTGWFDWVHGELWLCRDGLLRRSRGLVATVRQSTRAVSPATQDTARRTRTFADADVRDIVSADRRNRWIRWVDVQHVTLKRGIVDHSLHVVMTDGRREKLLWLKAEGGFDLVRQALEERLPGRFTVWDRRIG
jgi:hypothetical protein